MQATPRTHTIIANLTDGRRLYLFHRERREPGRDGEPGPIKRYTTYKRWAWKTSERIAEDVVSNFHRVQAEGYHHKDVSFYEVVKIGGSKKGGRKS